ncbi:2OG-Fe(II) oxygenase [Novilysobacter erysipheiresistens]|uniref:2OG-Fe(II) oxygenase n=1 Tax=Novilysobacter erysipheiresistens TaxID=1749332 RepID=A0ABU7YW33_9GAMM
MTQLSHVHVPLSPPAPASPDADDAFAALRADAAGGVPEPLFRLANALAGAGQLDEAASLFRRAAMAGHGGAQVEYARMLLFGQGCAAEPHRAVEWLLQAEGLGNPIAGYWLAWVAIGSVLLPRDGQINQRMLTAVQHDFPLALRAAAIHFGRKPGAADQVMCMKLLDRAAARGDVVSALLLAERLQRGEGCAVQPKAAAALRARLRTNGVEALPSTVAPPVQADYSRHPGRGATMPASAMLAFEEVLTPPHATELSARPRVLQVESLLSSDECRLLMASALLRDATADLPPAAAPSVRFAPVHEDFALRMLQLRLARAARAEFGHAEPLLVEHGVPGTTEWRHRDYLSPEVLAADRAGAGNRRTTVCVCLRPPEAGGGLEFPFAELETVPGAGRAVVFDNLRDGMLDRDSMHASLPILRGEQWQATLWLREGRYRAV